MKSIMEHWRGFNREDGTGEPALAHALGSDGYRLGEDAVNEGITDVVFHKTLLHKAADIMKNNKFMTSVAFGTPADADQNKGKLYYLSTMRSPTGDFGPSLPAVTFKLDGRKLTERSKAAAINYWGPSFPTDEMEDRVFTDEPYLEPATKYITEVHIGMDIDSGGRKMRPERVEEAEAIAAIAEGAGIPTYFYTNEKTYGIINKTKRLTLDQWKQAFKKAGGELDEPWDYESRSYEPKLLVDIIKIIKALESGNVDDIEKGYQTEWYNLKYDYGGGRDRQIKNAIHNSKSSPDARKYIDVIAKKVKKFGSIQGMIDWIQAGIKKTEGEQELKQVAERHGFLNEVAIGQCYPHAVKMAQNTSKEEFSDLSKFKVVHGKVTDKFSGVSVLHSWIEKGDTIYDWQTKSTKPKGIDRATYYDIYQPEIHDEYTAEETMVNCLKYKHPGPWDWEDRQ